MIDQCLCSLHLKITRRISNFYLCVDLLIEGCLLHLQLSLWVSHSCICLEFHIHHLLLTFCFLYKRIRDVRKQKIAFNSLFHISHLHKYSVLPLSKNRTQFDAPLKFLTICWIDILSTVVKTIVNYLLIYKYNKYINKNKNAVFAVFIHQ